MKGTKIVDGLLEMIEARSEVKWRDGSRPTEFTTSKEFLFLDVIELFCSNTFSEPESDRLTPEAFAKLCVETSPKKPKGIPATRVCDGLLKMIEARSSITWAKGEKPTEYGGVEDFIFLCLRGLKTADRIDDDDEEPVSAEDFVALCVEKFPKQNKIEEIEEQIKKLQAEIKELKGKP